MSNVPKHHLSGEAAGSSFESFLEEAGIAEEVYAIAVERVTAWQAQERVRALLKEQEQPR
ncbi:hypothetical protein [Rhizobium sp. MHM7A]|uniref:hypothetical protein n=1 Tax=Rhizobium sp. MHM7A TaxID=2583233 RepID=UPI0011069CFA|nr:hypothetical protein [Rhizobium sp. MHM7A]TLX17012.1 hypothetical protein FFR93_06770 [Rhizobium sp. MHM7A]